MPKELMEQFEMMKKVATESEINGFNFYYDSYKNTFCVFVTRLELLPEGKVVYEVAKSIDMVYKTVTVNGVKYQALMSKEAYEKEVA